MALGRPSIQHRIIGLGYITLVSVKARTGTGKGKGAKFFENPLILL